MKLCAKCEGCFEDDRYRCPDCDCILVAVDDETSVKLTRNIQRKADVSVGLRPDKYDWCMGGILAIEILACLFALFAKWSNFISEKMLAVLCLMYICIIFTEIVFRHVFYQINLKALVYKMITGRAWYPGTSSKIMIKIGLTSLVLWNMALVYFLIKYR